MQDYKDLLKQSGLKSTPRRLAIIEVFQECGSHLTPDEVWERLKKRFAKCGRPSVYRNLESLLACGILTRVQQFDRQKHYGLCTAKHQKHHHHIICIRCGRVAAVQECAMQGIRKLKGFKVVSHYMQINGICSKCAK